MTYNLYADVIFINNFTMDFFLLVVLRRIMKLEKRKAGAVLGAAIGALYALAVTVFPFLAPLQFMCTYGLMSTVMVCTAFRLKGLAAILKAVAGLYLTAVTAAGLMQLFHIQGGVSWYMEQLLFRNGAERIPFWVFMPAAGGCFLLVCFLWETAKEAGNTNGHLYDVILHYRGKSQKLVAFMDTGNHLREPFSRKPVSVISAECCGELFHTLSSVTYIPYTSVGKKSGVLPAVRADYMEIEKDGKKVTVKGPYIAISKEALSTDGSYQMLLSEKAW